MAKSLESMLETVPCNLCGSTLSRRLFDRPYNLDSLSENGSCAATTDEFQNYGRIVRCLDCGLVYTNPRPTLATLLAGYGSCVDDSYLTEGSSRSINAHLSLNTIKHFAQSGKLLEIGASTGYFLNAARVDFDVAGLEPSQWACDIARKRFKLDVYPEALESSRRFKPGEFDVVGMIDVIEHLTDPQKSLEAAARLLKSGGILYLVTPDIDSFSARLLRGYWWGLRPAHIYYFSGLTLEKMLSKAGLEIIYSQSFGRIFSYGYWLSRLKNYPSFIQVPIRRIIRALGIERKFLYLNTRDSIEICARKK